jgi:phage regulator Rha-like protein
MEKSNSLVPVEYIEDVILLVRGEKVIIDADLAKLYGVTTKRLNEQVRRNRERFPRDFMFQLTLEEKAKVVANCDHLSKLKFSKVLPYVFTEHGAVMVANVLNNPRAVQMSVFVVRAFVRMRGMLSDTRELARQLAALEKELKERLDVHEVAIVSILQRVMDLIDTPTSPDPPRKHIGFTAKEKQAVYAVKRSKR